MKDSLMRIGKLLTNNIVMKFLAVILAGLSYYAIHEETGEEIHYDVPLEVVAEEGVAVLEKDTQTVEVTFRGSREDLRGLEQSRIKAVLRPKTTVSSGSERVEVTPRDIKNANDVRVVKIKPSFVSLTFDREVKKTVRVVKPVTKGMPLIGRAELEYTPKEVTVRGPRLRLQGLSSVSTEPVDVDGRVESFSRSVRVLSPSDKWVSEIEPDEVKVDVSIITELSSHVWTNVPVLAVTDPGTDTSVEFIPPQVTVTLQGRPEVIEELKDLQLNVFANCLAVDLSTTNRLPVYVYLPVGTEATAIIEPDKVAVLRKDI